MDPKMGARTRSFFGHLALFSVPDGLGSPNGPQGLPLESPRPVQASISIDFGLILDDFLMIFCIMWATLIWLASLFFELPRAFIFKFLATSSNVLGSPVGVSKVTKNVMWPTFCLPCLFVFVASSPTFQVSGHRFSGSSVELLANCG